MKRKYRYVIETCGECGHSHRVREYVPSKIRKYPKIVVRDISPLIKSLDSARSPLSKLICTAQKHSEMIKKYQWKDSQRRTWHDKNTAFGNRRHKDLRRI